MFDMSLGGYVAALPGSCPPAAVQQITRKEQRVTVVGDVFPLFSGQLQRGGHQLLRATQSTFRWTKVAVVHVTLSVKQVAFSVYPKANSVGGYVVPHVRRAIDTGISAARLVAAGINSHIESAQQCAGQYMVQVVGKSAQLTALASMPIDALGITVGELAKTVGLYGALAAPFVFPVAESCVGGLCRLLSSYRVGRADARTQQSMAKTTSRQEKVCIAGDRVIELKRVSAHYKKLSERRVCSWPCVLKTALSCLPVALVVPQIGVPAAAVLTAGAIVVRIATHVWSSNRYSKLAGELSDRADCFQQQAKALQIPAPPPLPPFGFPISQPSKKQPSGAKADRQCGQEYDSFASELSMRLQIRRIQLDRDGQTSEAPQWGGLLKPVKHDHTKRENIMKTELDKRRRAMRIDEDSMSSFR